MLYFIPFEYLVGWTQFKLDKDLRQEVITNLKANLYSDIYDTKYPKNGTWLDCQDPGIKIFQDSTLKMAFIFQGNIRTHEEYCGTLYISDNSKIKDSRLYDFLGREFHANYLCDNWYWVDCYVDRTPGP